MKYEIPDGCLRVRVYVHSIYDQPRVYYLDVTPPAVRLDSVGAVASVSIGPHVCSALKLVEYDQRIVLRPIFLSRNVRFRE